MNVTAEQCEKKTEGLHEKLDRNYQVSSETKELITSHLAYHRGKKAARAAAAKWAGIAISGIGVAAGLVFGIIKLTQ